MVKSRFLPVEQTRHHWSNWVGFIFFMSVAALFFRRSMIVGFALLPILLHEAMVAFSFLLRQPARGELQGWRPRIAAYAGTFFVLSFAVVASTLYPGWLRPSPSKLLVLLGYLLWLCGVLFSVWTTWRLRRSFSLVPQAREIVTAGPYRLARHPIYTAYIVQYVGFWLAFRSLALTLALLVWFGLTLVRIRYEELVLAHTFPEYAEYRLRVGMFGPRLFPFGNKAEKPAPLLPKEKLNGGILAQSPSSGRAAESGLAVPGSMWIDDR